MAILGRINAHKYNSDYYYPCPSSCFLLNIMFCVDTRVVTSKLIRRHENGRSIFEATFIRKEQPTLVIHEPLLDPSAYVTVTPGVRLSVISETSSGLVAMVSGAVTLVVSETVLDPSGFVMVVVCVVVTVPSGPRVLVVTSVAVGGVTGLAVAVALPASTAPGGELKTGTGIFCKARVAQPAKAHKMEAMMHKIPAVSILQSPTLVQISEARATWNKQSESRH
jgi:hypothetical protein